ncbi:MAG TPA: hypothetical protein VFZ21_22865 [Gemmatimonadaceae bacterium]|jgi:hypothetical protein|nr:hypothetical protein [Gemmatimonadaceae bacterium]
MDDQPTCGKGLAGSSALPAALGAVAAALSEVLMAHQASLDLTDADAKREHEAYQDIADAHRLIAAQLDAVAKRMAAYRDLPMGPHDMDVIMGARAVNAFVQFVQREEELLVLLQQRLAEDRAMLGEMQRPSAST